MIHNQQEELVNMPRKKVCYCHIEDNVAAAGRGTHHGTTTLRMLLISSSKMIIIVSSFLLSLYEASAVNLSAFAQEINKKATTVNHHNRYRRKMVHYDASVSNYKMQGQSNFLDAMALSYHESINELTKKRANMRIKKNKNSFRELDEETGLLATRTFSECIEQSLSPEECQTLIQTQIENAGGHEVGDVQIKIHTPRTPEQFAESYWMVEVPVNLYAKMTCDRNDGKTFYPFKWMDDVTGTSLDVEDQDCYGLSAGECCLKIRNYGKQLTTTGYDNNKQCLSCFVHQEPLEPVLNEETGETDYLECKDSDNGDCVQEQLTGAQVDVLDLQTVARIETAITSLESFQNNRSCDTFDQLVEDLYNAAVVIPPLSIKIGRLACMVCYGVHDLQLEDNFVSSQLAEILMMFKSHSPPEKQIHSKENCIIIYTNADGEVVREPTLGGSRSDMIGKETVPHEDDDVYYIRDDDDYYGLDGDDYNYQDDDIPLGPCYFDPDVCADTEWCNPNGYCLENLCITDPPEDCDRENEACAPSYLNYYNNYRCAPIDCKIDPSICKENEDCIRSGYDNFTGYDTYSCGAYKELGEDCGFSYYGNYYDSSVYKGECDPEIAFCVDPFECTYTNFQNITFSQKCIAYGEGSCLDENGQLTQSNCKRDEYCYNAYDKRCKPNRNIGECCLPWLNNCGYGSDFGTLICAPDKQYDYDYTSLKNIYVCQVMCNTDDDCGNNEWCAPVDEFENDSPNYPGKFCKQYKGLGDYCHVKLPGLVNKYMHTEERCDPSSLYCYDPNFCLEKADYYYESQCRSYGNECKSDTDCVDPATEWCDPSIGYCKDRSTILDCCTTAGDDSKSDCPPGSSCEEVIISDTYYYYNDTYYYFNVGAATCTKP